MLQDIRAGRRTEIDALSGAVVALGQRVGVPTPLNRMASDMVRFMDERAVAGARQGRRAPVIRAREQSDEPS